MALDINQTYTLLQAINQTYPPQTLFRDTFFPNIVTFPTESVLIDYKKGTRKMAPFVVRGGGKNVARSGFNTKEYKPPMMAPTRPVTVEDITKRSLGENVFSTRTPEQRAQELRAADIAEMQDMCVRRIEWMCAQAMLNGAFTAKGYADDGKTAIEDTITYPEWAQKVTLTGEDLWTADIADIYGNLEDASKIVSRNSGRVPGIGIGSYDTCKKILNSKSVLDKLMIPDRNNMALMSIQPRIITPGVTRIGLIQALNLEIYAYDGIYEDEDGNIQQYIPDGMFVIGNQGRGSQLFGAVTQMDNDGVTRTYEGSYVPKVWNEIGHDATMIRIASKAVPKPETTDDWYTIKAY